MRRNKVKGTFPIDVWEYLADTNRFTCTQHGMYLLLLLEYWKEDGYLRNNPDELCEITKVDARTYKKQMPAVLRKFEIEDGFLRHRGLDSEREKFAKLQEKRRKGGRLSAKKRWGSSLEATQLSAGKA